MILDIANIYDYNCPFCGGRKQVIMQSPVVGGSSSYMESFGYYPRQDETVVECYCPQCGVQFHYPYTPVV